MSQENENVFIAESQSLNVDEQQKKDILDVIESCSSFQETIKQLEEKNLIWYFIGPLHKDKEVRKQISSKWKIDFQQFEQSIDATHKELKLPLPGQNFLAYSTKGNDFKIRFENEEKSIEISNILRASSEGKVYNISLGKDSQITATKKGSERHYDFTGSTSCEMTINWQAKDSKGNSISCSMTVEVDSSSIKRVVNEPKFGGITSSEEVSKLIEQNKEVFINGKTLYQAFTDMDKSVDDQQVPAEEIFTKDPQQSPTPSSSGYSSPGSRRSSLSVESEVSDEEFEITNGYIDDDYDKQKMHKDYKRKYKQEGLKGVDETINEINKLAEQRDFLRDEVNEQRQVISEKNQRIKEQDTLIESLMSKEQLKNQELVKELNQLYKEKEDLEMAIQQLEPGRSLADELSEENTKREIEKLQYQLKEKEGMLTCTQEELASVKESLEQLQNILQQEKGQAAISTQTEVEYESREIRASDHIKTETTVPETQDQGIQAVNNNSSRTASGLRQENKRLARDKLTIFEQLKQKVRETDELKKNLKQLQEENKQLKQEVTKNAGVDVPSSTGQKEAKEAEVIPQNIMDWPVPIPDDKPEQQRTPLEPIKVNTELSDPKSIPAKGPEKSPRECL